MGLGGVPIRGIKVGGIFMNIVRESVPAAGRKDIFCLLKAAIKFWRMPLVLVAVAVVSGCAGPTRTGASLDALTKTIGVPKAGQARVIVLRNKAYAGLFDAGWKVHLDGVPMGDLKTGTFVYGDRPAGPHQLTFERPGELSRASHHEFAAARARTYFFRLELNAKGRLVAASAQSAGLAGLFISSAISAAADDRGFFDFILLDDAAAREAMADLRLAE